MSSCNPSPPYTQTALPYGALGCDQIAWVEGKCFVVATDGQHCANHQLLSFFVPFAMVKKTNFHVSCSEICSRSQQNPTKHKLFTTTEFPGKSWGG